MASTDQPAPSVIAAAMNSRTGPAGIATAATPTRKPDRRRAPVSRVASERRPGGRPAAADRVTVTMAPNPAEIMEPYHIVVFSPMAPAGSNRATQAEIAISTTAPEATPI